MALNRDLPALADFSKKAALKAVLITTLQKPAALYPAAIGVVGVLAISVIGFSTAGYLLAVCGLSAGIGSWIVNFCFRGQTFENRYFQQLRDALLRQSQQVLESLKQELGEYADIKGAEGYAPRGIEQFKMAQEKFNILRGLLEKKLNEGELTYMRYAGTVEQVYLSVLDNLKYVTDLIQSASAINDDYITAQLTKLEKLTNPTEDNNKEAAALSESRELRESQLKKVSELLSQNEQALAQIDQATAVVANMRLSRGKALGDLETARKDLEDLIRGARSRVTVS